MQYRELGRTGWKVSSVSFGTWAIGAEWGAVDDQQSLAALHSALDRGVNFFDTADVYGDGRSERLLAQLRDERSDPFYVATKAGRRLNPHVAGGYNRENLTAFVERSLRNLKTDALDLCNCIARRHLSITCRKYSKCWMIFRRMASCVTTVSASRKSKKLLRPSSTRASNQSKSFSTCSANVRANCFSERPSDAA